MTLTATMGTMSGWRGMCKKLYAVLPALPAKGEAGPQISLGQQLLQRDGGSGGKGAGRKGATSAAAMAAAGGEVQAGQWG